MLRHWIVTSPDLDDFLYRDWGDVRQVFRLQRERTRFRGAQRASCLWLDFSFAEASFSRMPLGPNPCWISLWRITSTGVVMSRMARG